VIAGTTASHGAGATDIYLIKLDSSGHLLWEKTFGGSRGDGARSLLESSDRGYLIAGYTASHGEGDYDAYLVKTSAAGKMLWHRTFGGAYDDGAKALVSAPEGGYVVAGFIREVEDEPRSIFLVKTDSSGRSLWTKSYGEARMRQSASGVAPSDDGGYVVAGHTQYADWAPGDVLLLKTDSTGTKQWEKSFGGTSSDSAFAVARASDQGFIIAGITDSYGHGEGDVYMIKTDKGGSAK
jgi:hypothetical protein